MIYRRFLKRIFDILAALIILPFVLVIILITGLFIVFEDKGTFFYNAPRLGKDGAIFIMYKIRSMKMNAPDLRNPDGSTFNSESDSRYTKVGKFIRKTSIDELPQIFNIIKGDMSFIGPRPDLPEHRKLYVGNEERKLEVKPGMTGYSQAYYRNQIPWKERIQADIYYIDNLTFMLDVKIVFRTVVRIFSCDDVFAEKTYNNKD